MRSPSNLCGEQTAFLKNREPGDSQLICESPGFLLYRRVSQAKRFLTFYARVEISNL